MLSPIMVDGAVPRPVRRARGAGSPDMLPVMPAEANVNERRGSCAPGRPPAPSDHGSTRQPCHDHRLRRRLEGWGFPLAALDCVAQRGRCPVRYVPDDRSDGTARTQRERHRGGVQLRYQAKRPRGLRVVRAGDSHLTRRCAVTEPLRLPPARIYRADPVCFCQASKRLNPSGRPEISQRRDRRRRGRPATERAAERSQSPF